MTHSNVAEKCKSRTKSQTSFDQELCNEIVEETLTGVDRTKKRNAKRFSKKTNTQSKNDLFSKK